MRGKNELYKEGQRVNEILKEEADRLQLGTKGSLARLSAARSEGGSAFSTWAELEFREFVRRMLEKHTSISSNSAITEGARMLGVSPATTKRYMAKLRTARGPFGGLGDIVVINANYVSPEMDDYWKDVGDDDGR